MNKLIFVLLILKFSHSQIFYEKEEIIEFFQNYCVETDVDKKIALIQEKKRVVDLDKNYEAIEGNRFAFLGKGGYSRVYADRNNNRVVKMIKARKLKSITSLNSIHQELLYSNIYYSTRKLPGAIEACEYHMKTQEFGLDTLFLDMQILNGMDMHDYIWDVVYEQHPFFQELLITLRNVLYLVADYADLGLAHRDLKPGNIFMVKDKTSYDGQRPLLIDFAFTMIEKTQKRYKGTRKYMPLEMLAGDKKSDWYNLTIDTHLIAETLAELILDHIQVGVDIDCGLASILDTMMTENHCYEENEMVFCRNTDTYYEDMHFNQIIQQVKEQKKITCTEFDKGLDLKKNFIKCFELSDDSLLMTKRCRPSMQEAREMYQVYMNWQDGTDTVYPKYIKFFKENNYLFDYAFYLTDGMHNHLYNYQFRNMHYALYKRKIFKNNDDQLN